MRQKILNLLRVALVIGAIWPCLVKAEPLQEAERYLNSISSFSAKFIQQDSMGNISQGRFMFLKPGYVKWEYETPEKVLIVTRPGTLVYYDQALDEVTYIGTSSIPGYFLASERIKFGENVVIKEFYKGKDYMELATEQEGTDGSISQVVIRLGADPMALLGVMVISEDERVTEISFADARYNLPLSKKEFEFRDPKFFRSPIDKR